MPTKKLNIIKDFSTRAAGLDTSKVNKEERTIRAIVVSENPVITIDWERWELCREIVLIDGMEMPSNRQVPLLNVHSSYDLSDLIGSIRNLAKENIEGVGMCITGDVTFSSVAEEEWKKAEEGHLTDISAGFRVYKEHTQVLEKGQTAVINGRSIANNYGDDKRLMVRVITTLKEGSAVPIGADVHSKMMRSISDLSQEDIIELKKRMGISEPEPAPVPVQAQQNEDNKNSSIKIRSHKMPEIVGKTPDEIRKEERERQIAIRSIADKFKNNYKKGEAGINDAIEKGLSADEFRKEVFDNFDDTKPVATPVTHIGMTERDMNKFSITRALNAQFETLKGEGKGWKGAGFEKEVLDEVKERVASSEIEYAARGIILPEEIINSRIAPHLGLSKRVQTSLTPGAGGYLVGTDHMGSEYIELMRNKQALGQLGVRMLTGLTGNIEVPKQTGAATLEWTVQAGDISASSMTFDQVTLSPKEGKAALTYGRKLLRQSVPSIDALVIDDILKVTAIGKDYAGLHGLGSSYQPKGIFVETGTNPITGADLDWGKIVDFETAIAVANADVNSMKWLTNATVRGICKKRQQVEGQSAFLWEKDGTMNGYPAVVSNQVAAGHLAFGDWSQEYQAEWGVIDLLVNPYLDRSGNITVSVFVLVDFAVRVASAFSIADNVS